MSQRIESCTAVRVLHSERSEELSNKALETLNDYLGRLTDQKPRHWTVAEEMELIDLAARHEEECDGSELRVELSLSDLIRLCRHRNI